MIKITDNSKIPTSVLMKKLEKKFKVYSCWIPEELDENFPPPTKNTTRYFSEEQESSYHKGKSWDEIKDKEPMMTLREYILFFQEYYRKNGIYPDEKGWTLFRDSLPSGEVACGFWNPYPLFRKVKFSWNGSVYSHSFMGARIAVSNKPSDIKCPHCGLTINEK